ncbi:MAG: hypothetical protein Q7T35_09270 [Nitrosomonas sp.]|nr:hypothetical protein [Nitrosomonas sp.]
MYIEQIIEILQALLTPLIAIVATYIAYQQWQTNKQKLTLDRYERRLKVYEEVRKILSIILRDANANYDDLLRFRTAVSEADFLFGNEIPEYIDEIYNRGIKLHAWNSQYRDSNQPSLEKYDHIKVVNGIETELTWLSAQFEPAKQKFKKYLDISK